MLDCLNFALGEHIFGNVWRMASILWRPASLSQWNCVFVNIDLLGSLGCQQMKLFTVHREKNSMSYFAAKYTATLWLPVFNPKPHKDKVKVNIENTTNTTIPSHCIDVGMMIENKISLKNPKWLIVYQHGNCGQFLTIVDNFENSYNYFYHFDNWKDNPGDLWHLRHWLQIWQLRTWICDNLFYLTINCDTGQHSQSLRCFWVILWLIRITKVLGVGKTPFPPCWENFPNNPVISFWRHT